MSRLTGGGATALLVASLRGSMAGATVPEDLLLARFDDPNHLAYRHGAVEPGGVYEYVVVAVVRLEGVEQRLESTSLVAKASEGWIESWSVSAKTTWRDECGVLWWTHEVGVTLPLLIQEGGPHWAADDIMEARVRAPLTRGMASSVGQFSTGL